MLQAPHEGGDFLYRSDLRSDSDPNYNGVAKLPEGKNPEAKSLKLVAGTMNVSRGKNTALKVSTVKGARQRVTTIFSYLDRPSLKFSAEEQVGFYEQAA